jgi:ABC-2 type transport system ATP-binding protein
MSAAITARGLRKAYGEKVVLDGLDLDIAAGSIFALLGPNGAGKTTTVNILSTLVAADGGRASVAGHDPARDPDAVRAAIGVTGQFSAVDGLLTGEENLLLMADLHHLDRAEGRRRARDLLERFDLSEAARKPAATYSGGMRRRLDLAMGLVGRPRVLFLDEPSTGLDPRSRRALWNMIRELAATGITILLTTHYREEADQLADRISLVDRGRVVADGTADELKARTGGDRIDVVLRDGGQLGAAVALLPLDASGVSVDPDRRLLSAPVTDRMAALSGVVRALEAAGIEAEDVVLRRPTLDEVFLHLTGDDHRVKEAV